MKRTIDIVQAQIAAYAEMQRELELITGRIVMSTGLAHREKQSVARRLENYVADKLSDLRFEERQMRNRANVHA